MINVREPTCEELTPRTGPQARQWVGWVPLVLLPLAAIALRGFLNPWVLMWVLAAFYAGCKWQMWWEVPAARRAANWKRDVAYLLLWPGMIAGDFFETGLMQKRVPARDWLAATAKTLAGAALIWAGTRLVSSGHPMVAGWSRMIGLVLFLHFGTFYLIAPAWQSAGIRAEPIMQQPFESRSLSELWGKRWNLGFRTLSHALVFRPLQERFGTVAGTLGAFLASGLIHDLVISVPARGGYGLPTAYFLAQGFGVIAERSDAGQRLGLGHGVRGRVWAGLIALGPVFILFHPWFVMRVTAPFLRAIRG